MANLPKADELIGSTVTQQQFKTKLKQLVENIDRSYSTLAEANLDIANIGVGAKVDTDDSGRHYKTTLGATSLTKSPYDPLSQAKTYTVESVDRAATTLNYSDLLLSVAGRAFTYADGTAVGGGVTAIPDSSGIEVKTTSSSASIILTTPLSLIIGNPQTLTHKFKATAATSTQFMSGLTFGDGDNLRNVNVRNDGTIYTTTKTSATSVVLAAAVPQSVYAVNDVVECIYDWTGTDLTIQVKTPNGTSGKYTISEVSNKNSSIKINQRGICTYTQYSPLLGFLKDVATQTKLIELSANAGTASNQTGLTQNLNAVVNYGLSNSNGSNVSGSSISIVGSNLIYTVTTSSARNQIVGTDLVAEVGTFFEAELQFQITALTGTSARYMGLSVGSGASRRHYAWQGTGGIIEYDDFETVISTIAATSSTRSYDVGSLCKIILIRKTDGSGTLKVYVDNIIVGTYQLGSVPSGKVYICARSAPIITYSITLLKGSGYNSVIAKALATVPQGTFAKLVNQISVPDAQAANASGGFTCTGAQQIGSTGKWSGCWAVGNHGQVYEGSTVYNPSIVLLSPDRTRKLKEWDMSVIEGIQSIQGVAWDSSDDTIWFVDKTNRVVRHIDFTGALLGDAITIPVDYTRCNGIAYNPTLDALYIQNEGVKQIKLISCVDGTTVLGTWASLSASADQFHYDANKNWLMYSFGDNGIDGQIHVVDLASDKVLSIITLNGSQSIEGVCIANNGNLVVFNDGGYHTTANPPLNISCEYKINFDF